MANDGVIIHLSEKPPNETDTKTYNGGKKVTVTRSPYPPSGSTQDFFKFTHEHKDSNGGNKSFTLKAVVDDNSDVIVAESNLKNVTSVSAYYWKHDKSSIDKTPEKVLIVGVITEDGTTRYYAKDSNTIEWSQINDEELETYLDHQNCYNNSAVTLDLSFTNSDYYADEAKTGNNTYCCHYHLSPKGDNSKGVVSVERGKVSCKAPGHDSSQIETYKHTITGPSLKLVGIKYYENDVDSEKSRIRIKPTELNFPILDVQSVYAIYCTGESPVLIYIEGGNPPVNKWFKKPTSTAPGDNEDWINVGNLTDITEAHLRTGVECGQWSTLVDELKPFRCGNLGTCPVPPPSPPLPPPILGPQGDNSKDVQVVPGEKDKSDDRKSGNSVDKGDIGTPGGGTPAEPGAFDRFIAELTASGSAIAGYFLAGSAGAGATFFGGWKLYNRYKGDPWVRQI